MIGKIKDARAHTMAGRLNFCGRLRLRLARFCAKALIISASIII